MENKWIDNINNEVTLLRTKLSKKQTASYKLGLVQRCAIRISKFSSGCDQCTGLMKDIEWMVQELKVLSQGDGVIDKKEYFLRQKKIISHLGKTHNLIEEGYHVGIWMCFGVAFGAPLGLLLGNISMGLPFGLIIGLLIGSVLDKKAKDGGYVI